MLTFEAKDHTYRWNGSPTLGTTSVIEELYPLPEYAKNDESSLFGRATHKVVELHELGRLGRMNPELEPMLVVWKRFRADTGNLPVLEIEGVKQIEIPMYCQAIGYAGTPDVPLVDRLRKRILLADIKTGVPSPRWDLQTAAYQRLVMDLMGPGWTYERVCVQLRPGDWRPHRPRQPFEYDFNIFVSMINALRWARAAGVTKEQA